MARKVERINQHRPTETSPNASNGGGYPLPVLFASDTVVALHVVSAFVVLGVIWCLPGSFIDRRQAGHGRAPASPLRLSLLDEERQRPC
jgi:hypothetical protein